MIDPPLFNLEAEQAVIGAILLEPKSIDIVREKAPEQAFYHKAHRTIYQAMLEIAEQNIPIDLVQLTEALQKKQKLDEVGGVIYMSQLAGSVPTATNILYYVDILLEKHRLRNLKQALGKSLSAIAEGDNFEEILTEITEDVTKLSDQLEPEEGFIHVAKSAEGHEDIMEGRVQHKGLTGVRTAGSALDMFTGGRQKGELIVVAARPSIGKSDYMLNEALNAAKSGTAAGIFSLEMPGVMLTDRLISMIGHIDRLKLRSGLLDDEDWYRYTMARSLLSQLPIYIAAKQGQSIQSIRNKVKWLKREHNNLVIYIDYLQLVYGGQRFPNREAELGYISRSLKQIALENDCPVIAISAINRNSEKRQDKRPMLSDLRESGQIEFDADEVDFLYRDDYYNPDSEKKNITEIIIAKGRNTGIGVIEMGYLKQYGKFVDLHLT
jgi:replicative DNA helicase